MSEHVNLTTLIASVRDGSTSALDELFQLVYPELRRVAHRERGRGPQGTLNTTAVVHEAYLKLAGATRLDLHDRAHFFTVAARAMRQLLLDQARRRGAGKRGGGREVLEFDSRSVPAGTAGAGIVDLDLALSRLESMDERLGRVVSLRYFAGLGEEEVGEVLGITSRTVRRDWRKARAFLYRELYGNETR
jgi:RNA polymerase sigma factor (TIGR02999 family)